MVNHYVIPSKIIVNLICFNKIFIKINKISSLNVNYDMIKYDAA